MSQSYTHYWCTSSFFSPPQYTHLQHCFPQTDLLCVPPLPMTVASQNHDLQATTYPRKELLELLETWGQLLMGVQQRTTQLRDERRAGSATPSQSSQPCTSWMCSHKHSKELPDLCVCVAIREGQRGLREDRTGTQPPCRRGRRRQRRCRRHCRAGARQGCAFLLPQHFLFSVKTGPQR